MLRCSIRSRFEIRSPLSSQGTPWRRRATSWPRSPRLFALELGRARSASPICVAFILESDDGIEAFVGSPSGVDRTSGRECSRSGLGTDGSPLSSSRRQSPKVAGSRRKSPVPPGLRRPTKERPEEGTDGLGAGLRVDRPGQSRELGRTHRADSQGRLAETTRRADAIGSRRRPGPGRRGLLPRAASALRAGEIPSAGGRCAVEAVVARRFFRSSEADRTALGSCRDRHGVRLDPVARAVEIEDRGPGPVSA